MYQRNPIHKRKIGLLYNTYPNFAFGEAAWIILCQVISGKVGGREELNRIKTGKIQYLLKEPEWFGDFFFKKNNSSNLIYTGNTGKNYCFVM